MLKMFSKSSRTLSTAIHAKLWTFQPPSRCLHLGNIHRIDSRNDTDHSSSSSPKIDFQTELNGPSYCPPLSQPLAAQPHHHPVTRTLNVMGFTGTKDPKTQERIHFPHHCDVVIIGGGIMGCSIAYWLKKRTPTGLNIVVVERDPTYSRSSTVLSVGGLRQQFSLPENIEMSLFGAEFLREAKKLLAVDGQEPPDVQFHPHGYLFLASENGAEQLTQNHKLQKELGAKVKLLSPAQLKSRFPWISTGNVALASYGLENEGWYLSHTLIRFHN